MLEFNKVYCGDCLDILKMVGDNSVDCIITDPPYGIDYQSCHKPDKTQWKPKISNDKKPFTIWTDEAYRILKDDSGLLCFTRWDTEQAFRDALTASGFKCKQQIIWDKVVHGMGDLRGDFASQHENIIFATKGKFKFKGKRPKSIFREQRVSPGKLVHPNEKPVGLLEKLICSITVEGDSVCDMFAGSFTTAIACNNTKRKWLCMDDKQENCNIGMNRLDITDNHIS